MGKFIHPSFYFIVNGGWKHTKGEPLLFKKGDV
jgi:hypothetical protein